MASNRFIYYILIGFITANLLLIFIQFNSSKNINTLVAGNEKVINEFKVEAELRDLRRNIVTVETAVARALNVKDTSRVADLQREINAIENTLGKLQRVDDNDSSVKYIDQLDDLIHKKIYFNNRALKILYEQGSNAPDTLINNARGKELTDSITAATHKIDSSRRVLLTSITNSVDKSGQDARRWGTVLFIMVAASGAALFWFIINRVRQQNLLIQQLDASEKKVKEAARVKENFMANMSHEIRTPMNAIIGFTGLLKKKHLDADAIVYVDSIKQSGENLLNIVNDILDFSKFEAGMMRIEPVPFSLREMLQSIETMFHEKCREKNLLLEVSVDDDTPDLLEGDASRLTQILTNLAGNAIKFTDKGSVTVRAATGSKTAHSLQLQVSVSDTGIGIEKEALPGIFDRFKQAEASITRKYGGTGLGLSIVKDLVELQKGTIAVSSEPGKGSRFQFTIPYKIIDRLPDPITTAQSDPVIPAAFTQSHILVVEDNEINQTLMKHLLGEWQLPYAIASSGQKAIDCLREKEFDIVLMDIQMPEMDGYTAAQHIRQELQLNIPIIAMTAHALAGEREKCIGYGMNDYISKPISPAILLELLSKYITQQNNAPAQTGNATANKYTRINLQYMQSISNGNIEYEKLVTEQFIEQIPVDLLALERALDEADFNAIRQVAHNMKTTVSIMGLTEILQPSLDALEYDAPDEAEFRALIAAVHQICQQALEEARHFYATR